MFGRGLFGRLLGFELGADFGVGLRCACQAHLAEVSHVGPGEEEFPLEVERDVGVFGACREGVAEVQGETQVGVQCWMGQVGVEPGFCEFCQIVYVDDEAFRFRVEQLVLRRVDFYRESMVLEALRQRVLDDDRDVAFGHDVLLRLWPWRLDAHEGVEVVEDFVRFAVDLAVDFEEDEGVGVGVGRVVVGVVRAVGFRVEDQAVDVFADLGWEGEEVKCLGVFACCCCGLLGCGHIRRWSSQVSLGSHSPIRQWRGTRGKIIVQVTR